MRTKNIEGKVENQKAGNEDELPPSYPKFSAYSYLGWPYLHICFCVTSFQTKHKTKKNKIKKKAKAKKENKKSKIKKIRSATCNEWLNVRYLLLLFVVSLHLVYFNISILYQKNTSLPLFSSFPSNPFSYSPPIHHAPPNMQTKGYAFVLTKAL